MRSRWLALILGLAVGIGGVLTLTGVTGWVSIVAVGVAWVLALGPRLGSGLAVAITTLSGMLLLLALVILTALLALPLLLTVTIVWSLFGFVAIVLIVPTEGGVRRPSLAAAAVWVPSLTGALLWFGGVVLSAVIPGAARFAWVMTGDSANNVLFARAVNYDQGVAIGAAENPTPLPSVFMGLIFSVGRDSVAPAELTRHDISAFVEVWSALIMLSCVLVGAVVATIARRAGARPLLLALASAGGSLLPLSWFFTGYPVEYGFFNTHVILPVVMATFLAFLSSDRHPALALAFVAVGSTLLLAVWGPLVLIPGALGVTILVLHWREIVRARGALLFVLLAGIAQLLLYGIGIVLPGLLRNAAFLVAPGGVFGFRKWMIGAVALVAVGLAVLAFKKLRDPVVLGVVAIAAGSGLGLGVLLWVTRNSENPWSYYPLKYAWLASMILLVVAAGAAIGVVARWGRRTWIMITGVVVVAAGVFGFLSWAPSTGVGYVWLNPIERIWKGEFIGAGDEVAERIFKLSDPAQSHVLWHSGDPGEGTINFWLWQLSSDSMDENLDLKYAAYGMYDPDSIEDLCRIVGLLGGGSIVHTEIPDLATQLAVACPEQDATVVIDR